jgi:hypothetical protein
MLLIKGTLAKYPFIFMADALYILKLRMRRRRRCWRQWLSSSASAMLHGLSSFTWLPTKAPSNNLSAIKSSLRIKDHYSRLGQALLASMQRHWWYLSERLVLVALADDDIELELKSKILDKLLDFEVPDLSCFFYVDRAE